MVVNKIYVAGHRGMVGSAIVRTLQEQGQINFVTRTHADTPFDKFVSPFSYE